MYNLRGNSQGAIAEWNFRGLNDRRDLWPMNVPNKGVNIRRVSRVMTYREEQPVEDYSGRDFLVLARARVYKTTDDRLDISTSPPLPPHFIPLSSLLSRLNVACLARFFLALSRLLTGSENPTISARAGRNDTSLEQSLVVKAPSYTFGRNIHRRTM